MAEEWQSVPSAPEGVIAYHGCSRTAAERIVAHQRFLSSENTYDWLGKGIYFWEYAPWHALEWAKRIHREPAVVMATVRLGRCLNLLDREGIPGLEQAYAAMQTVLGEAQMPTNTSRGAHRLDCLIVDFYCRAVEQATRFPFQTVRSAFPEGRPLFPGSKILTLAHVQIAVRDTRCLQDIREVALPQEE